MPSATTAVSSGPNTLIAFDSTPELIANVQQWLATPASNFGWILIGEEVTAMSARRMASRENTSEMPVLTIEFTDLLFADGFEGE